MPDQLIKRRGESKLLLLSGNWEKAEKWIRKRMDRPVTVDTVTGILDHFIVEPFVPHDEEDEHYVAITAQREGDTILFHHEGGGVNVGDVDAKAVTLFVRIGEAPTASEITTNLLGKVPKERRNVIAEFIEGLFRYYADLNYTYLEINPFVVDGKGVIPLDLAAKLDDTADFISGGKWGAIDLPTPFGRMMSKEEAYIEELNSKTGASLKLAVLNTEGRLWTMVAGGGASVIYADTVTDLGFMDEMANYREYSGDPNEEFTYLYARTIMDLMTRHKNRKGKFLLIGGGIANFTDVANTFRGIIRALREYEKKLKEHKVKIYVRRGGPNYKGGLNQMRALGEELGDPHRSVRS
jgi:ATP citrate (pro-S)-lyase